MGTQVSRRNGQGTKAGWIPPLEAGDRLTRAEFERRYDAMPNLHKAELLEGMVYMPSPVRVQQHGRPSLHLMSWLGAYAAATPGVEGADNATNRLDDENEPQPDGCLYIVPECGGQARISEDDYLEDAPELAAEVTASTVSYDLHVKFDVYRTHGVQEYIAWRVLDKEIDWFILRGGNYDRLQPGVDGILQSKVFPGLWLDAAAMIGGDLARVLQVLQQGTSSPEHAAFVDRLKARRRPAKSSQGRTIAARKRRPKKK